MKVIHLRQTLVFFLKFDIVNGFRLETIERRTKTKQRHGRRESTVKSPVSYLTQRSYANQTVTKWSCRMNNYYSTIETTQNTLDPHVRSRLSEELQYHVTDFQCTALQIVRRDALVLGLYRAVVILQSVKILGSRVNSNRHRLMSSSSQLNLSVVSRSWAGLDGLNAATTGL